jgi:hypothetical protein
LLFAVAFLFAKLVIALLIRPPLSDSDLLQFRINDGFALFDLTPQHRIRRPLQLQGRLIAPQCPVQLIGTALVLQPQALMPFSGLMTALAGTLCPLFELGEPLPTGCATRLSKVASKYKNVPP